MAILLVVSFAGFAYAFAMRQRTSRMFTVRLCRNARNPHGKDRSFEQFGIPGIVVANDLLDEYGLSGYSVVPCDGITRNVCSANDERIILSKHVYDGSTNVAVSVAAHEAAHAKVDSDSPWLVALITRLTLLKRFLYLEIPCLLVVGLIYYGFGATDAKLSYVPMLSAVTLLVTNVLIALLTLVNEYRASFTAMSFIERQYGACGRKSARCASIMKEGFVTYAWAGAACVLGSLTLVLLFALI